MPRSVPSLFLLAYAGFVFQGVGLEVGLQIPTELPGPGFPGLTADQSNAAWPSGKQPAKLSAWPQTVQPETSATGEVVKQRKLLPCWKNKVLRDVATGWPGQCLNLFEVKQMATQETCGAYCMNEPLCPVWQFGNDGSGCWAGYGINCMARQGQDSITVAGAQRLQHGDVRVLMNASSWQILGLFNLGVFQTGSEQEDISRCRDFCYSDIACQYWQYGNKGCWVDAPYLQPQGTVPAEPPYPLTKAGATDQSMFAKTIVAGEYIQHYCPPQQTTLAPVAQALPGAASGSFDLSRSEKGGGGASTAAPSTLKGWPHWWWMPVVGVLLLSFVVAGIAFVLYQKRKGSMDKGNKRGLNANRGADNGYVNRYSHIHEADHSRYPEDEAAPPPPSPPVPDLVLEPPLLGAAPRAPAYHRAPPTTILPTGFTPPSTTKAGGLSPPPTVGGLAPAPKASWENAAASPFRWPQPGQPQQYETIPPSSGVSPGARVMGGASMPVSIARPASSRLPANVWPSNYKR